MNPFKPTARRDISRREKVICLDIGADRKARLSQFCASRNISKTDMIKQMIDHCIEEEGK